MWYQNVYVISLVSGALAAAITYFLSAQRRRKQQQEPSISTTETYYYECGASFLITGLLVFLGIQLHGTASTWTESGGDGRGGAWGEAVDPEMSMIGGGGGGAGEVGVDDSLFQSFADKIKTGTPKF
jgi:hypothetical protein